MHAVSAPDLTSDCQAAARVFSQAGGDVQNYQSGYNMRLDARAVRGQSGWKIAEA